MVRSKLRYAVVVMVICAAIFAGASQTQACWWRHCGNWGWGGYGCSSGYGGYGGWYSPYSSWYGGYGSLWGCKLFSHCRYYSPCWGCYDSCYDACGCYSVGYDSGIVVPGAVIGGSVTPATPLAPTPAQSPAQSEPDLPAPSMPAPPTPAPPAPPAPAVPGAPAAPAAPGTSTDFFPDRSTSGLLTVWVPADAKVIINGLETQSTGSKREYVSFGLVPGLAYKYTVQAQIVRDGKMIQETKNVTLVAGSKDGVAFGFNPEAAEGLAQNF